MVIGDNLVLPRRDALLRAVRVGVEQCISLGGEYFVYQLHRYIVMMIIITKTRRSGDVGILCNCYIISHSAVECNVKLNTAVQLAPPQSKVLKTKVLNTKVLNTKVLNTKR